MCYYPVMICLLGYRTVFLCEVAFFGLSGWVREAGKGHRT